MDKKFWQRVDALQVNRGISTKELASDIGVSYDVIRQQKYREQSPKAEVIVDIAECLHTSTDYLLRGKPDGCISAEARYVDEHPEARVLIAQLMKDPALLQALALVIRSAQQTLSRVD